MLICHPCIFFGEVSMKSFAHFLKTGLFLSYCRVLKILYVLGRLVLVTHITYRYLLIICTSSFHSMNSINCKIQVLKCDKYISSIFSLMNGTLDTRVRALCITLKPLRFCFLLMFLWLYLLHLQ